MTQTTNRILDEFARLMTDAAGVARGVRDEAETVLRSQAEKVLRDLDVVQREEFEAVRDMAVKAREENERLSARIAELEAKGAGAAPKAATRRAASGPVKRSAASKSGREAGSTSAPRSRPAGGAGRGKEPGA